MKSTPTARIYRPTPRNLARLARVLADGGLVATPSETVYGLAADALNAKACRAIFRAKGRPADDPLIVHVASVAQAETVAEFGAEARRLARAFWPGPLTLVLPKRACVPEIVTSGLPSVAIRMPAHPLFLDLIRGSGRPLAAPSANPFGYVSPTTARHVADGLGRRIRHILDGGAAQIGVESTILDLRNPARPAILRPGAVSRQMIERVLGRRVNAYRRTVKPRTAAIAPGLLARHYSPRTPITLVKRITPALTLRSTPNEALLFLAKPGGPLRANVFWLSEKRSDLTTAAHRLFDRLRALDDGAWDRLWIELAPGKDALAAAINDRLARAASK